MKSEESELQRLYRELEDYEKKGIRITLEGSRVSPMQIVTACMIREEGCYMRDYIMNPVGNIEEVSFDSIAEFVCDPPRW